MVLSADGKNASVKINRGKTLEVLDSHSAVMGASNGAKAIINDKFSSNGSGLELLNNARGRNNGVINAGFLRDNKTITVIFALIKQARKLPAELYKH
ncbi:IS30 family transposase [Pectobacterium brasiliense]|nr:IS30 family transposase [Pectobacterium brasiliense]